MKKFVAFLLAIMMILALCACGKTAPEEAAPAEDAAAQTTDDSGEAEEVVAESGSDVFVLTDDMIAADQKTGELDEEKLAAANDCRGESVEALYAAIGEPDSTHYAPSCMDMSGEDGQLFYDRFGFYVATLKNADGETVQGAYER